jgi:hypothetical protein
MVQFLSFDKGNDVIDMGLQGYIFRKQMHTISHPSEAWGEDPMPVSSEDIRHAAPAPASMPGPMDQYKRCHPYTS